MSIDFDKIRNLLERVTAGGAGEVAAILNPERKTCAITWKRPNGLIEHESFTPRYEMLMYVKQLLEDEGVGVVIDLEVTLDWFFPED